MISAPDRRETLQLIEDAVAAGARRAQACAELGLSLRSLQRWQHCPEDRRPSAQRAEPANKLTPQERRRVLEVANQPEFASLPPQQIVARLADQGTWLASESTFYRLLKDAEQQHPRGRSRPPVKRALTTHVADGPNQLWCWDITWLPTTVKGRYFYWYMIKDVYSRKLVANEVHESESAEQAAQLLRQACLREQRAGQPLVLHSDNGSAMKGSTMLAAMQNLGVMPSFSRPRVSNDNAYAEALFRTAKYCPLWPERPFDTLEQARNWVNSFVAWYNHEHRHSALKFVTPAQRHTGQAEELLRKRIELYEAARFLVERGALIVGVSDTRGTLANAKGIDIAALDRIKAGGGAVTDGAGDKRSADAIIDVDCDIWIPAARPDVLREDNCGRLRTHLVLQGANIPFTLGAEKLLAGRGVTVIPDFVANAGGVICAAMEYAGATRKAAFDAISERIRANTKAVLYKVSQTKALPRDAAFDIATEGVKAAMATRRWGIL